MAQPAHTLVEFIALAKAKWKRAAQSGATQIANIYDITKDTTTKERQKHRHRHTAD